MVAREPAPTPETSRDYAAWAHRLYSAAEPLLTDGALKLLREPTAIQAPAFHLLRSMKHLEFGDRPGAMGLMRKAVAVASEEDREYYRDLLFAMELNWDSPAAARVTLQSTAGNIEVLRPALLAARSIMAAEEGALSRSAALAGEALAQCPPEHPLRPQVFARAGFSAFLRSEFELAEDLCSRAVALAEMSGLRRVAYVAFSVLQVVAFEWRRDHDLSRYYAERMTAIASEMHDLHAKSFGLLSQLVVASFAAEEGRYIAIRDELLRRRASSEYNGRFIARISEVLYLGAGGRFGDARRLLECGLADTVGCYPLSHCYRAAYLALLGAVMLGLDDLGEARRFARRALSETRRGSGRFEYPTEGWIRSDARAVAAAVCAVIGDRERARRAMSGEFKAHISVVNLFFSDEPNVDSIPKRSHGYAALLLAVQRAHQARQLTAFTPAEHLVISGLREGATNAEIAARLSKSPATVKMQLQSVYQKLGVHSRANAIRRLREMELGTRSPGGALMTSAGERAVG